MGTSKITASALYVVLQWLNNIVQVALMNSEEAIHKRRDRLGIGVSIFVMSETQDRKGSVAHTYS